MASTRGLFPRVVEPRCPRSKCGGLDSGMSFLPPRLADGVFMLCPHMAFSLCTCALLSLLSCEDTRRLDQGPTLVTSSNLHHLLHVDLPVSKYRHAGVWASTWKCGGTKSVHSQGRSVMSAEASSRNFPQLQRKRMTPFLILFFYIRNVLKFCVSVLGASTAAQSGCCHFPLESLTSFRPGSCPATGVSLRRGACPRGQPTRGPCRGSCP